MNDCPQCGGSGQWTGLLCCGRNGVGGCCGSPEPGEIQCEVCGGAGQFPDEDVRVIPCEFCEGNGRLEYGAPRPPHGDYLSKRCNYCNGTGRQEIVFEPITLNDMEEAYD